MSAPLCFPVQVVYLTNSGSEANDLAMLMARLHTGNFDIITFRYEWGFFFRNYQLQDLFKFSYEAYALSIHMH